LLGVSSATNNEAHNNSTIAGNAPATLLRSGLARPATPGQIIDTDIFDYPLPAREITHA
jgi:hypothetical protein